MNNGVEQETAKLAWTAPVLSPLAELGEVTLGIGVLQDAMFNDASTSGGMVG